MNDIIMKRILPDANIATGIASQGFVQPVTQGLWQDVDNHLKSGNVVFSITKDDQTVGFAVFKIFSDTLYLSGIILIPKFQGHSIGGRVIGLAHQETRTKYLALRTQSACMWSVGNKLCSEWYPSPTVEVIPTDIHNRGNMIAEQIDSKFPLTTNCYNESLYGEKPLHKDCNVQTWWDSICNFKQGDAIICMGRF